MFSLDRILGYAAVAFVIIAIPGPSARGRTTLRTVRDGFVVGFANPKVAILYGAILPQCVDRAAGHVSVQMAGLVLVNVMIALVCDDVWGFTAGTARDWFARSPRRLAMVGGAGGLAMIVLGASIAFTGRKFETSRSGGVSRAPWSPAGAGRLAGS